MKLLRELFEATPTNMSGLKTGTTVKIKQAGGPVDVHIDGFRKTTNDMWLVLYTVNGDHKDASVETFKGLMV